MSLCMAEDPNHDVEVGLFHSLYSSHLVFVVSKPFFLQDPALKMIVHSCALSKRERKLVMIYIPDVVGLLGGVRP